MSNCLPSDKKCLAKEEAARVAAEEEEAKAMEGVYQPENNSLADESTTGLVCTMDGFTKMISELFEVLFAAIAVVKETALAAIPPNFQKAVQFAWEGAVGMQNWIGYVLAAIYFLSAEGGF